MDEYIKKLNMYLPIDFGDRENNEYRKYLVDTFLENCKNEKYQFALMAYHMMFMSFLYKEFWELKNFSYSKVERLCLANGKFKDINTIFDASVIAEQTVIDQYLSIFSWHINKKNKVKGFVETRDACAHASGFIQYQKDGAERYFKDVLEYVEKISAANKLNIIEIFFERLKAYFTNDIFNATLTGEYISNEILYTKYSVKNIADILVLPMPDYIENNEAGDLTVAYYFAMLQLHSLYVEKAFEYQLKFDQSYYTDKLYLYISILEPEKRETLQVQLEDELMYLTDGIICSIDLDKVEQIIRN
jgi:hypothetical protein